MNRRRKLLAALGAASAVALASKARAQPVPPSSLSAQPAGTGTIGVPSVNILSPPFRPQFYNCKFDGSTDDTAGWTNLITDLTAKGYGQILMPPGTTLCQPGIIKLVSSSELRGAGLGTVIQWTGSGSTPLVDLSGTDQNTRVGRVILADFSVIGAGSNSGALIRAYYSAIIHIENIFGNACNGQFLDVVQMWDGRITNVQCDGCANVAGAYAFRFRNSGASSGFGFSTDNCNQIHLRGIRAESFLGGGLSITQGISNSAGPNGFYVDGFKMETAFVNGVSPVPFLNVGAGTSFSSFRSIFLSANAFQGGSSTPVVLAADASNGFCLWDGIFGGGQVASIVSSVLSVNTTSEDTIGMVVNNGSATTTGYVVNITGGTAPFLRGPFYSFPSTSTTVNGTAALLSNFANDAAAATGGIAIGQMYRNGSVVQMRVT